MEKWKILKFEKPFEIVSSRVLCELYQVVHLFSPRSSPQRISSSIDGGYKCSRSYCCSPLRNVPCYGVSEQNIILQNRRSIHKHELPQILKRKFSLHRIWVYFSPIASSPGGDPWESSYHHHEMYPYDQPVATSTGHFVDPLAYPSAAPAAVAAPNAPYPSYAPYESAGPSAYPRINVSATNRYYDNQGYTPSTLSRF